MALCAKCGAEIFYDAKTCPECGAAAVDELIIKQPENKIRHVKPEDPSVYNVNNGDKKGYAIVSLVLGIAGLGTWYIPFWSFLVPVSSMIGIIMGIKGKKSSLRGMAKAGLIMSIIGFILAIGGILMWLFVLDVFQFDFNQGGGFNDNYYNL